MSILKKLYRVDEEMILAKDDEGNYFPFDSDITPPELFSLGDDLLGLEPTSTLEEHEKNIAAGNYKLLLPHLKVVK